MDGKSINIIEDLLSKLKEIVPAAFTEDKLNIDQLKQLLGESSSTDTERYQLNWAGKGEAFKTLQTPTTSTLEPELENSLNWDSSSNIFIEGENLEVLKVLQKSYFGKVDVIYIDPPYNTGSDSFIYPDKFSITKEEYQKLAGEKDFDGQLLREGVFRANRKENGQYHSNWLSMMLPRLYLSRNLLKDDGFIFISIDDNELSSLKLLMDEIYGEENFRNILLVRRYDKNINTQFLGEGLKTFNTGVEYVLIYSKNSASKMNAVFRESSEERKSQGYWKGFWNDAERKTMQYELLGVEISEGQWKWKEDVAKEAVENYEIYLKDYADKMTLEEYWEKTGSNKKFIKRNPQGKGKNKGVEHWIAPSDKILRNTLWQDIFASKQSSYLEVPFNNPKNVDLLKLLFSIGLGEKKDGIILDFFAGSGSTANAVIEYNEENDSSINFITVQLPEEIDEKHIAYPKGYRYISEVTRSRIKEAISYWKTKSEVQLAYSDVTKDFGYRSFKLTPSNFKIWRSDKISNEAELIAQAELFSENVEGDTKSTGILWELVIKNGYSLSATISEIDKGDSKYYVVGDNALAIITSKFTDSIQRDIISSKPKRVIALDSVFNNDDCMKTNAILKFEQDGIYFNSI